MRNILVAVCLTTMLNAFSQINTFFVKPIQTDVNYDPLQDSSTISHNTTSQLNKLFLFLGGTNSSSSGGYNSLRQLSASLGYDFINLSYLNDVAAASLANSSDSLAFNKYREEICYGTSLSNDVMVDSLNSIYTRTLKLIQYLSLNYPSQNWGQYLATPTTLNWSKIIVGGHSQGSGHAAYIAKQFLVDRVLMFSGPNDYSDFFSNSANWLRQTGVTPTNRHFAYLSLNDEIVPFFKQFTNISGLGMLMNDDTTYVDNTLSPYENSHNLYTTQSPGLVILNHNVPVKISQTNNNVWTYMLTTPIVTGLSDNVTNSKFSVFPNPINAIMYITTKESLSGKTYAVFSNSGQLVLSGKTTFSTPLSVDLSNLKSGVYFLTIDNETLKVVKK